MSAYYNEIDPFAAEWLRSLIDSGLIADGEVDERSIEDVKPYEIKEFTQCHFFAGIGVWSLALRQAGWDSLPSGTLARLRKRNRRAASGRVYKSGKNTFYLLTLWPSGKRK